MLAAKMNFGGEANPYNNGLLYIGFNQDQGVLSMPRSTGLVVHLVPLRPGRSFPTLRCKAFQLMKLSLPPRILARDNRMLRLRDGEWLPHLQLRSAQGEDKTRCVQHRLQLSRAPACSRNHDDVMRTQPRLRMHISKKFTPCLSAE